MKKVLFSLMSGFCIFLSFNVSALVKITAVNGTDYGTNAPASIEVMPGDVVSLSADFFGTDGYNRTTRLNLPLESFIWWATDATEDFCDPSYDCTQSSNFQATEYGVNFYVPHYIGEYIDIGVKFKGNSSEKDTLRLINVKHSAPVNIYNAYGDDYSINSNASFDFSTALYPHGHFVVMHGHRYFIPYVYVEDWTPYRHGYWYWTSGGWAWYSYDPWGYVTDHCGYWRHHKIYGWIWEIPDHCVWRPAVVTWVFTFGYIGWIPYDGHYHSSGGYGYGYEHGFDDGYHEGYWNGYKHGKHDSGNCGFTVVNEENFYCDDCHKCKHGCGKQDHQPSSYPVPGDSTPKKNNAEVPSNPEPKNSPHYKNVADSAIKDPVLTREILYQAGTEGNVKDNLGGGNSKDGAKRYVEERTNTKVKETATETVYDGKTGSGGNVVLRKPESPPNDTPENYRKVAEDKNRDLKEKFKSDQKRPGIDKPLGKTAGKETGKTDKTDGGNQKKFGPSLAPLIKDPQTGKTFEMKPRTTVSKRKPEGSEGASSTGGENTGKDGKSGFVPSKGNSQTGSIENGNPVTDKSKIPKIDEDSVGKKMIDPLDRNTPEMTDKQAAPSKSYYENKNFNQKGSSSVDKSKNLPAQQYKNSSGTNYSPPKINYPSQAYEQPKKSSAPNIQKPAGQPSQTFSPPSQKYTPPSSYSQPAQKNHPSQSGKSSSPFIPKSTSGTTKTEYKSNNSSQSSSSSSSSNNKPSQPSYKPPSTSSTPSFNKGTSPVLPQMNRGKDDKKR
jgi:hypothetical protein